MKKFASTLLIVALAVVGTFAQGTIQLNNSVGTPFRIDNGDGVYSSADRLATAADGLNVEVWWGAGAELALGGTAGVGANGLITGGSLTVFQLAGSEANTTVNLQIRISTTSGLLYASTKVAQVTLGPTAGPGTVIWQGVTGTNPNRFTPILVVPEPSTIVLGVFGLGSLVLVRRRK